MALDRRSCALITGGSRGIGREVAFRLADRGFGTIFVNYLQNETAAAEACAQIASRGARGLPVRANLAFASELDSLFEVVKAEAGRLDVLVHCAALGAFKPLIDVKQNQWDISMNTNARAFLQCVQRAAPLMENGRIVALSSLGARRAIPSYGAIGPSKAALEAIVRQLAVELAPRHIRVNAVSAGFVVTDSTKAFPERDRVIEEVTSRTPCGRLASPGDIADVVTLLLSPQADWINGQTIIADGGYSLL